MTVKLNDGIWAHINASGDLFFYHEEKPTISFIVFRKSFSELRALLETPLPPDEVRQKQKAAIEAVPIMSDGRCNCSCADPCPIGRVASMYRCTRDELQDVLKTL